MPISHAPSSLSMGINNMGINNMGIENVRVLGTPLDGPGRRVSGVELSQDLSANVLDSPVDSCSIRGI